MAKRIQALCQEIVDDHGGDAGSIWSDGAPAAEVAERLRSLSGYGPEKTKIFLAILAKRFGVTPEGWEEVAGPFADGTPRSVADIDSPEALATVREWKKAQKARGKTKQE